MLTSLRTVIRNRPLPVVFSQNPTQTTLVTACRAFAGVSRDTQSVIEGVRNSAPRFPTRPVLSRQRPERYDVASREALHTRSSFNMVSSTTMDGSSPELVWNGAGMSQEDFMLKDECIVVDEADNITGHDNKKNCHRFVHGQETGVLHRAFSVFLFNESGELLLQQRAADKITFPSVWTNTCCSHPLHGYSPSEVDTPEQVADGSVPGVKAAAVRKLLQELGIPPEQVPVANFKFLTRLHYCAPDSDTYGPGAEWGEHEVDYILFIQTKVDVKPNPEEVGDFKYVNLDELQRMMNPASGLKWSPWFRIIVEKFLTDWWKDLSCTLSTDTFVDVNTIHRVL